MGLMGLSGLRAQQCDTIDAFPWMANFSGGLSCWQQSGPGYWTVANAQAVYGQLNVSSTNYITLTTPALRLDTDSTGLRLWWKDQRNYMYPNLIVIVQKEDGTQDTLYHADMGSTLTQHSVSLAPYVGQTVRIAFNVRLSSSGYTYRATLRDIGIYSQHTPLGSLSAPTLAVVGDTVTAVLNLTQGLAPLNYTWHSALLGDLVGSDTLRMVYPSSGWDTLTVMASNAYGTLSRTAVLRVHECPSVVSFPWREDFDGYDTAAYNVCWTIDGWSHRNRNNTMSCYDEDGRYASYSQLMTSSTNGKYMLSPAITIPATGTEHLRLWVQSYNMPTVRISPTASLLPADFTDTLIVGSSTGNTMVWRLFDLAPYAGQTIRVGLFRQGTTPNVNTVQIDYDTLPVIYAEGPSKTATGTSILLTSHLRHGATDGLQYTWHSQLMGNLTPSPSLSGEGSEVYVTYTVGGEDTITVIATNAFGSDTVRLPLRVVDCTPATVLPWSENFDDGLACWNRPQGSKFENSLHTSINQVHDSILRVPLRYDTLGSWIMSKEIHLPADTALLPRLFWTVGCSRDNYQTFYSLLVTDSYDWTDTTNYTHLITDSTVHTRSLYGADLMSLDLRPYAGRTIHLAVHNHAGHLSTNTTYLNFHSFEIRSTAMPRVALASDDDPYYYYGDTATFVATLVEGSDSGLVYTWHSTLLDSTIVGDTLLRLCYGLTSGIDTVTVVATNAYGSDTASAVVASSIINEPTVYLVAEGHQFPPQKAEVGDTVVYCATRNRCVTTGMTYLFHSSLMDTTVTVATTADTVRLPLFYPVAGIDTFTVTLSNIYDTSLTVPFYMTVLDCPPVSVPYMEDFESMTISYVPDCWDGGFWVVQNNDGRGAYFFEISNDAMLISPLIDLPADSLGLQLSWVSYYTFYINADVPSKVFVSPTGGKRDEDFTDTLYTGALCRRNGTGSDSVLLDAYRGSQVRIAFPSIPNTTCLYDDIRIDYNRTAPQVSLDMPGTINLHDTVLFTATINACSPQGLSVSWHSTLMGTNLTPNPSSSGVGSEVQLAYAVAGVDTIMVIVANAYGADTAVAVVRVIDCSPFAVPYSEDFEGMTATLSTVQGTLADCWDYSWNGSNAAYAPHVITNDGYQYLSNLPSQALLMVAGNATGYGNQAEVLLPRFADSLQTLSIAFDYRKESANIGTLTVGYYDGDTFTALQTMTPQSQTYRRDTVSFASAIVPDGRIGLRWTQGGLWYAVAIDNIEVFRTQASFFAPRIAIAAPATILLPDSATYSITLNDWCSPDGLSFTWHSTLLDSTIVTTESILTLGYTAGGIDTVTVVASNAYGADTAVAYLHVVDCNGAMLPYVETFEGVTPTTWDVVGESHLPFCWETAYNGTNGSILLPTVVNSYQFITGLPDNALLLIAGGGSTHSNWVQTMLPTFSLPLSSLVMSLDYRFESANAGTLTVGYVDDTLGFFPVKTLTPHAGSYTRDTVYFAGNVASNVGRIALRFAYNTSFYGVVVDNIEVVSGNGIPTPLALTVDSVSASCASFSWLPVDSATAYVVSIEGVGDTLVSGTAVTFCGLNQESDYSVKVAAIVGTDTSLYTPNIPFSTLPYCASPVDVAVTADGVVTWQYATSGQLTPTGVQIVITDTASGAVVVTDTVYGNSYTLSGLYPYQTYSIVVTTLCGGVSSNSSDPVIVTTPPAACSEVRGDYNDTYNFLGYYDQYAFNQMIYPAQMLGSVDTLFGIALRVSTAAPYNSDRKVNVFIDHTTSTSLASAAVSVTGMTQTAHTADFNTADTGWTAILFDTPFVYNGVDNLIVTVVDVTGRSSNGLGIGMHSNQGDSYRYLFWLSSGETINPYSLNFTTSYNSYRAPDIQFLGGCTNERCVAPTVVVDSATTNALYLSWQRQGNESHYQVEYSVAGVDSWMMADTTTATAYTLSGLAVGTLYQVRVGAVCADSTVLYRTATVAGTHCGPVSLPHYSDFATAPGHCWTGTGSYSENNGYDLSGSSFANPDMLISPEVAGGLHAASVTIRARDFSSYDDARYAVGVSNADGSEVVWIDTVDFTDYNNFEDATVYLNSYTGTNNHVAIAGIFSYTLVRSVSIDPLVGCLPVQRAWVNRIADTSATLHWIPEQTGDQFLVYLGDSLMITTTDTFFTFTGLVASTAYTVRVVEKCSDGGLSVPVSVDFTTACTPLALPWSEDFTDITIGEMPSCWTTHLTRRYVTLAQVAWPDSWYLGSCRYLHLKSEAGTAANPDTTYKNYASTPLLNVGSHGAVVTIAAQGNYGSLLQVGVMTDPSDPSTFVPAIEVPLHPNGFSCSNFITYQFSTDTLGMLPDVWAVAFHWKGVSVSTVGEVSVDPIIVPTHTLSLSVNDTTMGSVTGGGTYEEGSNVTIAATPNPGYRFVMWNDSVTAETRTVKMDYDTAFTAFFEPDTVWRTVRVNLAMWDGGEVYDPSLSVDGVGMYADSSLVTLTARYGIDPIFWYWITTAGDTIRDNPYSFVITADTLITAVFGPMCIGIEEVEADNGEWSVFPNPAHGDVTVNVSQPSTLTVIDLTGRVVVPPTMITSDFLLPASDLPAGTYFVQVTTAKGTSVKKLILR